MLGPGARMVIAVDALLAIFELWYCVLCFPDDPSSHLSFSIPVQALTSHMDALHTLLRFWHSLWATANIKYCLPSGSGFDTWHWAAWTLAWALCTVMFQARLTIFCSYLEMPLAWARMDQFLVAWFSTRHMHVTRMCYISQITKATYRLITNKLDVLEMFFQLWYAIAWLFYHSFYKS